jgi:hypothetical protein
MFLTLLQSGGAGPGVITGVLSAVESGADTFAATGTAVNAITGSLAAVETGADTFSATGIVLVQGALAAVETGIDTFAATGQEFPLPPAVDAPRLSGSSRDARQRRRPGIFPALPREAEPALPLPRRTRRRREAELVLWLNH